jgi:hypothetical protein
VHNILSGNVAYSVPDGSRISRLLVLCLAHAVPAPHHLLANVLCASALLGHAAQPRPRLCRPAAPCASAPTRVSRRATLQSPTPTPAEVRAAAELYIGNLRNIELRVDKPSFVQAASRYYIESSCSNSIFQRYIVKVDRDVAHVVMTIHVCLNVCLKYFIYSSLTLHVFLSECCKSKS